jgi:hypothetical protein
MMDNWAKNPDGSISVLPLAGWELGPAMDMALIVRLEFLNREDESGKPTAAAQMIVTPHQAMELGQALLRNALSILALKPEGRPS